MAVYFIKDKKKGLIKIGKSNNPKQRLSSLGGKSRMELLLEIHGDLKREKDLHIFFKDYLYVNEWFFDNKYIMAFIAGYNTLLSYRNISLFDFNHITDEMICWIGLNKLAQAGKVWHN